MNHRLPVLASLTGIVLGALAAGYALSAGSASSRASDFPIRAYLPQLANDEVHGPSATGTPTLTCGEERWSVKTLSDPSAGLVNFSPLQASVDQLRALPKPTVGDNTPRMAGVEFNTYTLTATLLKMKLEEDRDIHLVVGDLASGGTMIVEFPDTSCEGAITSAKKVEMQAARAAFVAACGNAPSGAFVDLTGRATITGVAFFDLIHGQTGIAPNGIELHPVLAIRDITCSARATPTASSTAPPTATGGGVCSATTATITALDKVAEVVALSGSGNLTGWKVVSVRGGQAFNFPAGFVASGSVEVRSGTAQFANTASTLWWTSATVWNNSEKDDAQLFDCNGTLVQTFEDRH